ncbi:MAG: hypothetical protein WD801_08200 [Gemmatimonadaceae bacterium]
MKALLNRARPLLLALCGTAMVAACDESLDGGLACPALCPEPAAQVRDTTLFAVVLDTSIGGFPPLGTEAEFALTYRPDTLETGIIVRYDSLPTTYRHVNVPEDSLITAVDSAVIKLRVAASDTLGPPITVQIYDVDLDSPGEDTSAAVLAPLFVRERLLGERTFTAVEFRDSLIIPILSQAIQDRINAPDDSLRRLRIGIRIVSTGSAEIQVFSSNFFGAPPLLYFRASPDTLNVPAIEMGPTSRTPDNVSIAADLADFQIIFRGPAEPPPSVLRVGGIPGRRVYMRFDIPSVILDSSSIIRATLLMTQRPVPDAPEGQDSMAVQPLRLTASGVVTDIARILLFISGAFDSTMSVPADSAVRPFELIDLVKSWRGTDPEVTPRAIALRSSSEGVDGRLVDFFSKEAPMDVRPRIRLTYVPRALPGLP